MVSTVSHVAMLPQLRLSAAVSPHSRWQADKEPPIDIPQIAAGQKKWNFNNTWLVVEPTHLKNISQNGNLPQIWVKIKNI